MKAILVGSAATKQHFPNFREPKDVDYWYDGEEHVTKIVNGKRHEYKSVKVHNNLEQVFELYYHLYGKDVMPVNMLYTIKVSHAFWNIHWEKTMNDIRFFQDNGAELNGSSFDLLYKAWEEIHGKKRAYLGKSNEDFFKDNVRRTYVHDDIHQVMAYNDAPLYLSCKKDPDIAMLSKQIFDSWRYERKLQLCREEIYVTALERFIIPSTTDNANRAYKMACRQLVTSMSKGWFPKFIVENWFVLHQMDKDYVSIFRSREKECRKIT